MNVVLNCGDCGKVFSYRAASVSAHIDKKVCADCLANKDEEKRELCNYIKSRRDELNIANII